MLAVYRITDFVQAIQSMAKISLGLKVFKTIFWIVLYAITIKKPRALLRLFFFVHKHSCTNNNWFYTTVENSLKMMSL